MQNTVWGPDEYPIHGPQPSPTNWGRFYYFCFCSGMALAIIIMVAFTLPNSLALLIIAITVPAYGRALLAKLAPLD